MNITILNGPNLNLLGTREPEIYGRDSLQDIHQKCLTECERHGHNLDFLQSNYEGQLVEWIQAAIDKVDVIVINAAAYTHTSVAIHDALRAFDGYKIELHISNPHQRESFRQHSYVSSAVNAVITGLGVESYHQIIEFLPGMVNTHN